MEKFYDQKNDRLVMLFNPANPGFWDEEWQKFDLKKMMRSGLRKHVIRDHTRRFLPSGAKILEGGCGTGLIVNALRVWGFDACGVDYAATTVQRVKEAFPDLPISFGDVRKLDFPEETFDGYWSLGVIEHFYHGFNDIIQEAHRILRPGGFFFVSFPYISPLRRSRIRKSEYPAWSEEKETKDFYQFFFNADVVRDTVEGMGFRMIVKRGWGAVLGMMDEDVFLSRFCKKIYSSKSLPASALRQFMEILFRNYSGHVALLVFQKK